MDSTKKLSTIDKMDALLWQLGKKIPLGESTFFIAPTAWPLDPNWRSQTYVQLNVSDPERGKLNGLDCLQACELGEWKELVELCRLLAELEFIYAKFTDDNAVVGQHTLKFLGTVAIEEIAIRVKGWKRIQELNQHNPDSQQGFVAMWFDQKMDHIYTDCIAPALRDAGYDPRRIDKKEHINKIDDEIIREIRRSRFVVADATGNRGGVYYEAGFAYGLGIPVFLTRKKGTKLHFDVQQYNCIDWTEDKLPEFKKQLADRIAAVLGQGKIINDPS
jgi:nucleoside 2-deoxyribosyltransferase